jgi:hypothetical protein
MSQSQSVRKEFCALSVDNSVLSAKRNCVFLAEASSLSLGDSGNTFYLNSATEFATTLPAVADASGFLQTMSHSIFKSFKRHSFGVEGCA